MGHGGVAADGKALRVLQGDAQDPREEAADGDPVADDGHGLAGVVPGDLLQGGAGALSHLGVGLAPLDGPLVLLEHKRMGKLRLVMDDVAEKLRLPAAHMDLPQLPGAVQGQIMEAGDGGGGEPGAVQVAGIERVDLHIPETLRQRVDLAAAHGGHISIPMPLHHAIAVALSLGMPNEINFRHKSAYES